MKRQKRKVGFNKADNDWWRSTFKLLRTRPPLLAVYFEYNIVQDKLYYKFVKHKNPYSGEKGVFNKADKIWCDEFEKIIRNKTDDMEIASKYYAVEDKLLFKARKNLPIQRSADHTGPKVERTEEGNKKLEIPF